MPSSSQHSLADCDRDTIRRVITELPARWPVERVLLFGSKARGDDEPDSDVDPTTANEAAEAVADAEAVLHQLIPLAGQDSNAGP